MEESEVAATFLCERGAANSQYESRALLRKEQLAFTVRRGPPLIRPFELPRLPVRFGYQILIILLHISPMERERRPARRVSDFKLLELRPAPRVMVRDVRMIERLGRAEPVDGVVSAPKMRGPRR